MDMNNCNALWQHFAPAGLEGKRWAAFQKLDELALTNFSIYIERMIDFVVGDDPNYSGVAKLEIDRQCGGPFQRSKCIADIESEKWSSFAAETAVSVLMKLWNCIDRGSENCEAVQVLFNVMRHTSTAYWRDELLHRAKTGQIAALQIVGMLMVVGREKLTDSFVNELISVFESIVPLPTQTESSKLVNDTYLAIFECYREIIGGHNVDESSVRKICQCLVSKEVIIYGNDNVRTKMLELLTLIVCKQTQNNLFQIEDTKRFWKLILKNGLLGQFQAISKNPTLKASIEQFLKII